VIELEHRGFSPLARLLKRALDLAVALPACIVLAPLFFLVALAIRGETPGPAFFRQQRRGQGMRPFTIVKFRSLRHRAPDPHARYEMLESDPRITAVGAFLRRTSLDELPQLFNVVTGSMSLVGPRPLVEWESQESLRTHPARFDVKPGLTGLSQVVVRNSADLRTRLDQDVEYVERWSLWLDIVILLRTPGIVLRGGGLYPDRAGQG
jgi:lipopolysaccharide/colanic/teichoic acid biosynthesis glycosyltransferase